MNALGGVLAALAQPARARATTAVTPIVAPPPAPLPCMAPPSREDDPSRASATSVTPEPVSPAGDASGANVEPVTLEPWRELAPEDPRRRRIEAHQRWTPEGEPHGERDDDVDGDPSARGWGVVAEEVVQSGRARIFLRVWERRGRQIGTITLSEPTIQFSAATAHTLCRSLSGMAAALSAARGTGGTT